MLLKIIWGIEARELINMAVGPSHRAHAWVSIIFRGKVRAFIEGFRSRAHRMDDLAFRRLRFER